MLGPLAVETRRAGRRRPAARGRRRRLRRSDDRRRAAPRDPRRPCSLRTRRSRVLESGRCSTARCAARRRAPEALGSKVRFNRVLRAIVESPCGDRTRRFERERRAGTPAIARALRGRRQSRERRRMSVLAFTAASSSACMLAEMRLSRVHEAGLRAHGAVVPPGDRLLRAGDGCIRGVRGHDARGGVAAKRDRRLGFRTRQRGIRRGLRPGSCCSSRARR